jgi:putative transposase
MIENAGCTLSVRQQCLLLDLNRSSLYYKKKAPVDDSEIMNLIRDIWFKNPAGGYRFITQTLNKQHGYNVNCKRVYRLMRLMNLQSIYARPNTSVSNPEHTIYPYLLKGMVIDRPNQVWCTDITYIKMPRGFIYLVAIIDVYSRYIVSWRISTSLDTSFCIEMLKEAFLKGIPGIVNTDQGCQFTSILWVTTVKSMKSLVSMDGVGRWADNIPIERFWLTLKYANVFLNAYETVPQAREGIGKFIEYYNEERLHQNLGYETPAQVYRGEKIAPAYVLGQFKKKRKSKKKVPLDQEVPDLKVSFSEN